VRIRCLFFAQLRDSLGAGEKNIELPEGSSVADAVAVLKENISFDDEGWRRLKYAVNEEFVLPQHLLCEGDALVLLPPASGG